MPPSTHLQWRKISEFGGLWDNGSLTQMPANAAQIMSGCHPQAGGGLRAFHAPRPWAYASANTGLQNTTGPWRVVGVYQVGRFRTVLTAPVNTSTSPKYARVARLIDLQSTGMQAYYSTTLGASYNATTSLGTRTYTLYSNPGQSAVVSSTSIGTLANPSPEFVWFCPDPGLGSDADLWAHAIAPPHTLFKVSNAAWQCIASHQSRVVGGYGRSIVFSAPGGLGIPTDPGFSGTPQFIHLDAGTVMWMAPLPPTDLLVGTVDGAVFNIQGDLADPIVRTVRPTGSGYARHCVPAITPLGAVVDLGQGPVIMSASGETHPIHTALDQSWWDTPLPQSFGFSLETLDAPAQFAQIYAADGPYIYARNDAKLAQQLLFNFVTHEIASSEPDTVDEWVDENELTLNGSLVYDTQSHAWFHSAHPDVADMLAPWIHTRPVASSAPALIDSLGVVTVPSKEFLQNTAPSAASNWAWTQSVHFDRAHTYEWKSAPLHSDDGRQIELHEVRFGASAYNSKTFVPGQTYNSAITPGTGYIDSGIPVWGTPSTIYVSAHNEYGETAGPVAVEIEPGHPRAYSVVLPLTGTYVSVSVKAVSPHPELEAPSLDYISLGYTDGAAIYAPQV